jgi:hypothetical protein
LTTHVHIPTRVRLDPEAVGAGQDCIAEALSQAAFRALRRSLEVVLEERGTPRSVVYNRAGFTWTGEALDRVSATLRRGLEERIADTLAAAVAKAGVSDVGYAGRDVSEASSNGVEERVDPDRFSAALALYGVPSYDNKGRRKAVPVSFEGEGEVIDLAHEYVTEWERIPRDEDFEQAVIREIEETGREFPTSGFLGVIYREADGKTYLTIRKFPSATNARIGDPFLNEPIEGLKTFTFRMRKGKAEARRVSVKLPPGGSYRLKFVGFGGTSDLNVQMMDAFYGKLITQKVEEDAKKDSTKVNLTGDELARTVTPKVKALVAELAKDVPADAVCFMELTVSGKSYLLISGVLVPPDLDIEVIPLSAPKRRKKTTKKRTFVGTGAGGAGAGKAAGERAGAGTAAGEQGAGEAVEGEGPAGEGPATRGGFIYTEETEEAQGTAGMRFPTFSGGRVIELVCRPFLDEPPVEKLGPEDSKRVADLIDGIAYGLQIPKCRFAAQFCLNAAAALGGRAIAIGSVSVNDEASTKPVEVGQGNLGGLEFTPVASRSIQYMRHLARMTSQITDLMELLARVYRKPEIFAMMKTEYIDVTAAWQRRFHIELTDVMNESVASIFVVTCRVLLLQLLRASKAGIAARLDPKNFDNHATLFEVMINSQLSRVEYLIGLRDKLRDRELKDKLALVSPAVTGWHDSVTALTTALAPAKPSGTLAAGPPDEVIKVGDEYFVRDRRNRLWTMSDLETAIALARGTAESIDPIIKQITDLPEVVERVKANPDGARTELRRILEEMQANNKEMIDKVTDSYKFAFRASKIQEHLPSATIKGTTYALQGIHKQVHEQIGEFFGGSPYYAAGIDSLFSATLGEAALTNFFVFTGLTFLSIVCPPLAFAIGLNLAVHDYSKALERERLYGSMIDPELVLTRAEVEAELFAAKLGIALSFIPEAGALLGRGAKVIVKQGVSAGTKTLVRSAGKALRGDIVESVGKRLSRELAEKLKHGFAVAYAREVLTDQVLEAVINKAIEPLMARIEREAMITGPVGGIEGAVKVKRLLEREKEKGREGGRKVMRRGQGG